MAAKKARKKSTKKRNAAAWWKVTGTDARGNSHHKMAKTKAECEAYAKKHGLKNVRITGVKATGTVAKRNGKTIIKAKRVTILNLSKKKNPPRKANITSASDLQYAGTAKRETRDGVKGWSIAGKFFPGSATTKAHKLTSSAYLDLRTGDVWKRKAKGNPSAAELEKAGRVTAEVAYKHDPNGSPQAFLSVAKNTRKALFPDLTLAEKVTFERAFKTRLAQLKAIRLNPVKKKNIAGFMQDGVFHPIRSGIEKRTTKAKGTRYVKSKKKYKPSAVKEKYTYSPKKSAKRAAQSRRMTAATKQRKATTSRLASRSLQRSYPLKGKRRNPDTPAQLLEQFRGYPKDKDSTLYFAEGTPTGLYKLGSLYQIKLVDGTKIKPTAGKVWLCADTKGKLYLGTTDSKQVLANAPQGNLGKVAQVEYVARKPHLGDNQVTRYYHNLGEETGEKPSLYSDGKGGLLFKGGATYIRSDGIHN